MRCVQCAEPFGFAVAFCPFCGAAQHAAERASPAASAPAIPKAVQVVTPAPTPAPAPVPVPVPVPAPSGQTSGQTSVPPVWGKSKAAPPAPAKPAPARPVRRIRERRRPARSWPVTLAAIGVIAAAVLARPEPAGTVIVYPTPGVTGSITIDGVRAGVAGERLRVPAGSHLLGYEADGWTAAARRIAVRADEQRVVTIVLAPLPATLVFDVQTPGAALRLDNQAIAAPEREHKVAAGHHRLTATCPGYAALAIDLTLARGERRAIPITLAPLD